jgi:hypothetical protein
VPVEMGSRAIVYIPNFIKIGSAIRLFIGGIHTKRAWWSHEPVSYFFFKTSRLKLGHSFGYIIILMTPFTLSRKSDVPNGKKIAR